MGTGMAQVGRGWAGLLCLLLCWGVAEARDISPKRECSICHVMWLTDFQRENVTPLIPFEPRPVEPTGQQDVVSTERMCFSCHDGFVRDSRFVWAKREHFHPLGIQPSEKIHIPRQDGKEIFPLNDDGKLYCGTCHSAHGVNWEQEYSPVFLRVENVDSSLCLACHLDRSTGSGEGNHPVFKPLEHKPAVLEQGGAKFGGNNDEVICQSCHRVHGAASAKKLLVVDNTNSALCGTCHDDRHASTRAEAARKGTHPVNVRPDKVKVPEQLLEQGARLGSGGEVICQTCHRPHGAPTDGKILIASNTDSALCQQCHQQERSVLATRHNLSRSHPEASNVKQQPAAAGVCATCHLPHGGTGPKMWARPPGASDDPMAANCLSCHQKGAVAEAKLPGMHSHPVGRAMHGINAGTGLPAYTRDGVPVSEGGQVTCASCHDPHKWAPDARVVDTLQGEGDASTSFLRRDNVRGSTLCLTCHNDKKSLAGTPHERSAMQAHASLPNAVGVCDTCHRVHQGQGPRMWALAPEPGVDPVSSICLSCHREQGVAHGRTVGEYSHPVDVPIERIGILATAKGWLTQVRDLFERDSLRPLPLFDERGRKVAEGGRVACASCHDPHSQPAKEGKFLRLANDAEATLCRNCHTDKGMVAWSKHNLKLSRPKDKQMAQKVNVCAQCHQPHNASGARLWATYSGEGVDTMAQLCHGCHQEGGMAQEKQVGQHSHPLRVDVKNDGVETSLPLFRMDGTRDPDDGRVSCPTCHNPHQWVPGDAHNKSGASAKVEGQATDSFLRLPAAPAGDLCVDCHMDARWVRNTDHDLRITAPQQRNARGQTVQESGVCGQCHAVHNAQVRTRLWGRETTPGQEVMESLCRSCHAPDKVAAGKVPVKLNHPQDIPVVSVRGWPRPGEIYGTYPVYDKEGKVVDSGVISCPTCHNAHQWQPQLEREGPGRAVEGNALNSFLRNKSNFNLCTNCHGLDALFRYKYFHGETSRVPHRLYR